MNEKRSSELMDLEKPARKDDSSGLWVCLLGASFDNCNRGVGALADGAIRGILTCFPEANISILDYGYEGAVYPFEGNGRRLPIELINIRFSKKVYLANNIAYLLALAILSKYVMPSSLRTRVLRRNRVLRHLAESLWPGSALAGERFATIPRQPFWAGGVRGYNSVQEPLQGGRFREDSGRSHRLDA